MKLFEPRPRRWPSAAPPSNGVPSTRPIKSITTVSPDLAGRGFARGFVGRFSSAMRAMASSTSSSPTATEGRSIVNFAKSTGAISGIISIFTVAFISPPSLYSETSNAGLLATRRLLSSMILRVASSRVACKTSPNACWPYRVLTTLAGTLPGRKPGILTSAAKDAIRASTRVLISAAVRTMLYSRSRPSERVWVTSIINFRFLNNKLVGRVTGIEPATFGTTNRRSNQLSYTRHMMNISYTIAPVSSRLSYRQGFPHIIYIKTLRRFYLFYIAA